MLTRDETTRLKRVAHEEPACSAQKKKEKQAERPITMKKLLAQDPPSSSQKRTIQKPDKRRHRSSRDAGPSSRNTGRDNVWQTSRSVPPLGTRTHRGFPRSFSPTLNELATWRGGGGGSASRPSAPIGSTVRPETRRTDKESKLKKDTEITELKTLHGKEATVRRS